MPKSVSEAKYKIKAKYNFIKFHASINEEVWGIDI